MQPPSPECNEIWSRIIFRSPDNLHGNNDATPGGRQTRTRAPARYGDQKLPSHTMMECHEEFVEHETDARARRKRTRDLPECRDEKSGFHDALTLSDGCDDKPVKQSSNV